MKEQDSILTSQDTKSSKLESSEPMDFEFDDLDLYDDMLMEDEADGLDIPEETPNMYDSHPDADIIGYNTDIKDPGVREFNEGAKADTIQSAGAEAKTPSGKKPYVDPNATIIDGENGELEVNWDLIEKNANHHRHRHHHHHHHHHSGSSSSSGSSEGEAGNTDGTETDGSSSHSSGHHHHHHHHHHHSSDSKSKKTKKKSSSDEASEGFKHAEGHNNKKKKDKDNMRRHSRRKRWGLGKKIFVGILIFLLCIIIGVTVAFLIMRAQGKKHIHDYDTLSIQTPKEVEYKDNGRTIYYDGHEYAFNENIASVLFMGVDKEELVEDAMAGTSGQADALYLFCYNTSTGQIKTLSVNRDSMTDITRYDSAGNYHDTLTTQLCLAYAYGDGQELSAENQVTAVRRLLYNVPINSYYAIDMSALKILNDDIGGVTVTPEYTFSNFVEGKTVTLHGDDAESFVRTRDITLLDDNVRRMACQRQYITNFANQILPAIRKKPTTVIDLYNHSSDYTVTNITTSDMTYLASTLAFKYEGLDIIKMEGEYQKVEGDKSAEFIPDQKSLFENILELYYTQVD